MELPFKYIVLCVIRTLNDRKIPLAISKSNLMNYFKELIKKSYFTIDEKIEISKTFDFEHELDDLFHKYYQYFDYEGDNIVFDGDYINDLSNLIDDEMNEFDLKLIYDLDFVIEGDTAFLDILGVRINKELYNYLLGIEKKIEECYMNLYALECHEGDTKQAVASLVNKLKRLNLEKMIMFINTSNLLSYIQQYDLMQYAGNIADKFNDYEEISLLLADDQFDEEDIIHDVFLKSIFSGSSLCMSNLEDCFIINVFGMTKNMKYSKIRFYLTFLNLLEMEIKKYDELLNTELIRIKYRLMSVLDSVYGTALFINREPIYDNDFNEDYHFIIEAVYYFIKELLMHDDEKYSNKSFGTKNTMVYLNSIVKKLLIETYYKLTCDEKVIIKIKDNELYGINAISSEFLKNIVNKPKSKIKEVWFSTI